MTDKTFNFIRFLAEIGITAIGALYWALSDTWGLPYGDEIVATCAALSTFLGIFTEWQRFKWNTPMPQQTTFENTAPEIEGEYTDEA